MDSSGANVAIWSLPEIPRKRVIHRMKLADILKLSLRSKPFHDFLKNHKLPRVDLEWIFERDDDWSIGLTHFKDEGFREHVELLVTNEKRAIYPADEVLEFMEFKLVKGSTNNFRIANCGSPGEKLRAVEALSKHVGEIAHLNYELHRCGEPTFDLFESFVFRTIKSFSKVTLGLEEIDYEITEKQLRFLLEHLDIESLLLKCSLINGGKLEKVQFNQRRLKLKECDWIEPNELLNNTRLEYVEADFETSDLSSFVRMVDAWQKGTGFQNLKEMDIHAKWWSGGRALRIQEDQTLGLVRTDDKEFPEFAGTIKRFSDGKVAEVKAWTLHQRRYRVGSRTPVGFFRFTLKEDHVPRKEPSDSEENPESSDDESDEEESEILRWFFL